MNFANAGIPVLVLDQDENLERGMGVIEKNYQMMVDEECLKNKKIWYWV